MEGRQPTQQATFASNLDGSRERLRKDDKDMYAIIPVMWTKHSWTNTLVLQRFLQTTTVSMEFRGIIPKEETKTVVITYKKLKRKKKSRKMKEDKFDFDSTEQHIYDLDDDIDPSELGYFKPAKIYTIPKPVDEIIEKTKELNMNN